MEIKDFKFLESPIKEYLNKVDNYIEENTRPFLSILDYLPKDSRNLFYKRIFYILKYFIFNDLENKELFIKIPSNELGEERDQWDNLYLLQQVSADLLFLATKNNLVKNTTFESFDKMEENSYVFLNKEVVSLADKNPRKRIWKKIRNEINSHIKNNNLPQKPYRLKEIFPHKTKRFLGPEIDNILSNEKEYFFLIRSLDDILESLKEDRVQTVTRNNIIKRLSKDIIYLESLKKIDINGNYKNALIVSNEGTPSKRESFISSSLFISKYSNITVDFATNIDNIEDDYDIIVLIGDNTYKSNRHRITRLLDYDRVKKIIYIGTSIFDDFFNESVIFPFTHREIYRYFSKNDFPSISIQQIESFELQDKINQFKEYLDSYTDFSEDEKNDILRFSIIPYLSWQIPEKKSLKERLEYFLEEQLGMDEDEIEDIIKSYFELFQDFHNLKLALLNNFKSKNSTHKNIEVPNWSYKNFIGREIRSNTNLQCEVNWLIDACGNWNKNTEILDYLLYKGARGNISFLTYIPLDKIYRYSFNEIKSYSSDFRMQIIEGIKPPKNEIHENPSNQTRDIASFYSENDYLNLNRRRPSRRTTYKLSNEVEEYRYLSGDVIINNETYGLNDLFEDAGSEDTTLPNYITIYQKPENFKLLMELKFDFPADRNVEYYSNLWKSVVKEYCKEKYGYDFDLLIKQEFKFIPKLKNYFRDNSTNMFPTKIRTLVNKILELGLVSPEEARNILAANRANRLNATYGTELKMALFHFKLFGEKLEILKDIEKVAQKRNLRIDADSIVVDSLKRVFITKLEREEGESE